MNFTIISRNQFEAGGFRHHSAPWRPDVAANLQADFGAYQAGTTAREIAKRRRCGESNIKLIFKHMGAVRRRGGFQPSHFARIEKRKGEKFI